MNDNQGVMDSAILMMALGEESAAEVFKFLTPREAQKLGEAMARTRTTSRDRVNEVLERFHLEVGTISTLVADTDEYVRTVLKRALGDDKAGLLIERILQGGDVSGIESLKWMDPQSVAELVKNEHPQIIACILVHLERDQSSSVLLHFTERLRNDVMLRIATLDSIQPNALRDLNDVLTTLLAGGEQVRRKTLGGSKAAAEIMNFLGNTIEQTVLGSIGEHDAELAQEISDQMFTFDDLARIDDRSIQVLLREVQSESLIVALKGAESELREKIFRNMGKRAAETLREDLEAKGPVRVSEVETEQKEILKTARRLAEENQLSLGGGGDDAVI